MPALPVGEKRMVSYALDTKTAIDREDKSATTEGKITISRGVMRTAIVSRIETVYTVKAPEKEPRLVVIEHPRMGDYKLVSSDDKDVEMTQAHYRLRVPVKAGETKKVTVALERQGYQSYAIADLPTDQLLAYAAKRGELDGDARKAFAKMAEVRRGIDDIDRRIAENERQRQVIFQDQERLRENLRSLSGTSDIQQKYLSKLNEQEDRVTQLDAARAKLEDGKSAKVKDLQDIIDDLEI
jgi:hypothetical protein